MRSQALIGAALHSAGGGGRKLNAWTILMAGYFIKNTSFLRDFYAYSFINQFHGALATFASQGKSRHIAKYIFSLFPLYPRGTMHRTSFAPPPAHSPPLHHPVPQHVSTVPMMRSPPPPAPQQPQPANYGNPYQPATAQGGSGTFAPGFGFINDPTA